MIDPDDPQRLVDSTDAASAGVREALRRAQRDVGSEEQVARLAARLGPLLAPPVAATAGASGAAGVGGAAKFGLGVVALLVAGGAAWLLSTPQSGPPSAPISKPAAPPSPVSAAATPAQPTPAEAPVVAVAAGEAPPGEASVTAPVAPVPRLPDKPAPPAQLSEAELLEQARTALKSDPARALLRANQHATRFPGGALVQEREVIAIKALRALGRGAEADRRAEAFSKAYPGSAFGRKLKPTP